MRNTKVKQLLLFLEKNKDATSLKELLASIDNKLVWVRKSHSINLDELALSYGKLVYECFRYLVYSWAISSDDISEKGNSIFIYWCTHIDLMLTYVEDFVGWDFIEHGIDKYISELTKDYDK